MAHVWGFEYVWEVYEPVRERRWGWYVRPLLHCGHLVGRIDAPVAGGVLRVARVFREAADFDDAALTECLERHTACCGAVTSRAARGR